MAKFARVGYGHDGRGVGPDEEGYTYVVNDNVRKDDLIQPSVIHYKSKKIFGTTGRILSTMKETSTRGQEEKAELGGVDIAKAYTGKELGAQRPRGEKGTFVQKGRTDEKTGRILTSYQEQARGGNILARYREQGGEIANTEKTRQAIQSFEEYSRPYMNNGGEQ